jgi:hypothetical protein
MQSVNFYSNSFMIPSNELCMYIYIYIQSHIDPTRFGVICAILRELHIKI